MDRSLERLDPEEEQGEIPQYSSDTNTVEQLLDGAYKFLETSDIDTMQHFVLSYDRDYELVHDLIEDIDYDTDDLEQFIPLAYSSLSDWEPPAEVHGDEQTKALGLYTGLLAHILTERNDEQGKPTRIHVQGGGIETPYLFYNLRYADEIHVENVRGPHTLTGAASLEGRMNILSFRNVEGDRVGQEIAVKRGEVGSLLFDSVEGDMIGKSEFLTGQLYLLGIHNVDGRNVFQGASSYLIICDSNKKSEIDDNRSLTGYKERITDRREETELVTWDEAGKAERLLDAFQNRDWDEMNRLLDNIHDEVQLFTDSI